MSFDNFYETPDHDYSMPPFQQADSEEERLDYNKTVLYEFLAKPKYPRCFEEAAKVLSADLGIENPNKAQRKAMEHLLFNLATTYRDHPDYAIRHYRSPEHWPAKDEVKNPYGVGHKIIEIIDLMTDAGYLRYLKGFQTPVKSRMSRMWPTKKFVDLILTPHYLKDCPVEYHPSYSFVRVHDEEGCYEATDSTETRAMRSMIAKYNALLSATMISVTNEDEQYIWGSRPVYRVFNKADLSWGGRFYGGWYQNIKSHLRAHIMINSEPTVELDFKSQHPYMLYGQFIGQHYNELFGEDDSPYTIYNQNGIPYPRALIKGLFLTALNASSFDSTWRSIHTGYHDDLRLAEEAGDIEKLTELREVYPYICNRDVAFKAVYEDFIRKHHRIGEYVCKGIGRVLQRLDSDIASYVLSKLTDMGIATLCIHDSFIVQKQHEATLREVMQEAYFETGMENALPYIQRKDG